MKNSIFIIIIGLFLSSNLHANSGVVINLAGKQRMLTQKMSKEALLIAKGIDVKANRKNLKDTIALFDKTLLGLRNGDKELNLPKTKNPKIIKQIDKVHKFWKFFKVHIDKVATDSMEDTTLEIIDKGNLPLLQSMNVVVEMYEKDSDSTLDSNMARTINLAGKQRMLTQKMTKELLLIANSLESNANIESLRSSGDFFKNTLNNLMTNKSEYIDADIKKRLDSVENIWIEYQKIIKDTVITDSSKIAFKAKEDELNRKMTKELLQIANKIDENTYRKNLKQTGKLFDKTLNALIKSDKDLGLVATKDANIIKQLKLVQSLWNDYKPVIYSADISKAGLKKAIEINIPLLQSMDKAVKMYEESVK